MAKRKPKTKAQREAEQYAALLQRMSDIYSGAKGAGWDHGEEWATAQQLAHIIPTVRDVLEIDRNSYLVAIWNINEYDTPESAAKFLFVGGIRV